MITRIASQLLILALLLGCMSGCGVVTVDKKTETRSFTDSCGRTVEIPVQVDRIVPSGPYAQVILFSVCPNKLISLSEAVTKVQSKYFGAELGELPVTGKYYGKGSTMNFEEIVRSSPDIIIDIGEPKETIAEDMDEIQQLTGTPAVFLDASLDKLAQSYEKLGELTGETAQARACAEYIRAVLAETEEKTAEIPDNERMNALYAQGEYGTEVLVAGTVHSEVLDYVGAVNVAEKGQMNSRGAREVSMEQICLWDPEVVVLAPDANYDEIFDDPVWTQVDAVKNGKVYEAPFGPYNWMDQPPSVQRILAIQWLGNLLYPEVFDYDMLSRTQEFYSLFWHYDMSAQEAEELLINSTCATGLKRG